MRLALLLALLAAPAAARETLDGAGFEAIVEGRSLAYINEGETKPWAVERHYEGRRVTWFVVATQECMEGTWSEEGKGADARICFTYDLSPGPHCFRYYRDADTIISTDLDGGDVDVTPIGAEHEVLFGCEYLGS